MCKTLKVDGMCFLMIVHGVPSASRTPRCRTTMRPHGHVGEATH